MSYTIPADNVAAGQSGHIAWSNNVADVLTGGIVLNVKNTAYAGGAKGDGATDDSAAIQAAINAAAAAGQGGAAVRFPPGNYLIGTALVPKSGVRIFGDHCLGSQIISTTVSIFNMGQASLVDSFEIDHLTLQVTGAHLFTGANVARTSIHDCRLIQNSSGFSIWNASPVTLMVESRFERNSEYAYGATRSVEAWFLSSNSGSHQINQCMWSDEVCFNQDSDQAMYWYHLQNTASNSAGNTFRNIVFEHTFGGAIWLESQTRCSITDCLVYDVTTGAGTISNHLFQISKNATGLASSRTRITGGPRNQSGVTFAASIGDISLDANCTDTVIIAPAASSDLKLYLNGSKGVKLVGMPDGGFGIQDSATTASAGAQAGTSPPAPVITAGPTNECGTVTFGTGSGPSAGDLCDVTFGTPFETTPLVFIVPHNAATWTLGVFSSSPSTTGFSVSSVGSPSASQGNTVYGVRWHAVA